MNTRLLASLVALVGGTSLALGQLVTDPPKSAPNPADHIQKAPMPAAPMAPIAPAMAPAPVPGHVVKAPIELPDLKYTPLLQKDDKGGIKPLTEPAEYAALRVNPMLKPEDMAKFQPYFAERKAAFEHVVIENLDLVEQIEGGIFETLDLSDNKAFPTLLNVSKPLRTPSAPKPLADELLARNLIDATQAEFNRKITKEYHLAILPQIGPDATPEQKGQFARRSLALFYKQGIEEPLFDHRQMLIEGSRELDKILPTLGLDKATAAKADAAAKAIKADASDDARVKAMGAVNAELSLDQRKELLRKVLSLRAK
jgi:hypothetical protein